MTSVLLNRDKGTKKVLQSFLNINLPCLNESARMMVKESVPPLMSETGKLATADKEKAEVLNNFFASVFTGNLSPHPSRVDGWHEGDQEGKIPPVVSEDQVRGPPEEPKRTEVHGT